MNTFKRAAAGAVPLLAPVALVLIMTGVAQLFAEDIQRTARQNLLVLVVVVALYIFSGNSGVISVCHVGFAQIGAYTTALLTMSPQQKQVFLPDMPKWLQDLHLNLYLALAVGIVLSALVALTAGSLLMKLAGLPAAIGTFGFLLMIDIIITNWSSMTGGPGALIGIPASLTTSLALGAALIAIVIAFLFQRSNVGLRLRASREDEIAAIGSGVAVVRDRLVAFVLSAGIAGLGGGLLGGLLGTLNPTDFGLKMTFVVFTMLIVGGLRSLAGAVVGAIVISIVMQGLLQVEYGVAIGSFTLRGPSGLRELGLAVVLILMLIARPTGLMRGKEFTMPRRRRRRVHPTTVIGSSEPRDEPRASEETIDAGAG